MLYFPLIVILFILLVLVTRPLIVLFHELGHAIPTILLTKEKVTIYIGSHGDPTKSLKLNVGLLEIWFRYNPLSWQLGLSVATAKSISANRQIICAFAGSLTSLFLASVACYFTFYYNLHGFLKLLLVVFLASSIIDLFVNLVPRTTPIKLHNGTFTHNDGYSIKRLIHYKRYLKKYTSATELYYQQKYLEASSLFQLLLTNGWQDGAIYQLAISSYLLIKDYKEAKDLSDVLFSSGKMTSCDFSNAGVAYSRLGLHDKALEFYDRSLSENPSQVDSLNNKGYTLNLMGRYKEAIPLFDKAIELEPHLAYAYNNRGLAKIKLGNTAEGLADINNSFKLDKDSSYGYMNLGIYHFDKGEYFEALALFQRAKEMDGSTYMIDDLIFKATGHINL